MQNELKEPLSQDYASQFLADLRKSLKARRNDSAVQAFKTRLVSGGS